MNNAMRILIFLLITLSVNAQEMPLASLYDDVEFKMELITEPKFLLKGDQFPVIRVS